MDYFCRRNLDGSPLYRCGDYLTGQLVGDQLIHREGLPGEGAQVILGDFLDNIMMSIGSPENFYSFFCQLASRIRLRKRTAILVIKEDIHEKPMVEMVKRFADIVLEFRDQDNEGALTVE